ncbi:MAG: hypothetical protein AB7X20_10345 [Alphaproteobacteria bacterium]
MIAALALLASTLAAWGASRGPDAVMEEVIETINEQADVLDGIRTPEDVEASKDEVQRLVRTMRELTLELETHKDALENDESLRERFSDPLDAAQGRRQQAVNGIEERLDDAAKERLFKLMEEAASAE